MPPGDAEEVGSEDAEDDTGAEEDEGAADVPLDEAAPQALDSSATTDRNAIRPPRPPLSALRRVAAASLGGA